MRAHRGWSLQNANISIDSQNLIADVALAAANLLGFDVNGIVSDKVAGPVHAINAAAVSLLNSGIGKVNGVFSGLIPAGMSRLAVWL
jgi:hypothetical protein